MPNLDPQTGKPCVDYCDPLIARRMGASDFPEG